MEVNCRQTTCANPERTGRALNDRAARFPITDIFGHFDLPPGIQPDRKIVGPTPASQIKTLIRSYIQLLRRAYLEQSGGVNRRVFMGSPAGGGRKRLNGHRQRAERLGRKIGRWLIYESYREAVVQAFKVSSL